MIKQPDGAGIIELTQFAPTMGGVFAADSENMNPFWQFVSNQPRNRLWLSASNPVFRFEHGGGRYRPGERRH